ncbi:HNH endonuclease family protein [Atopococcus tabaci]|uniref:HNH endonuclease family protein n=1 Tax=Atopococcus tabaci TaxID=269774 RepID=UPI000401EC06|nr:HNH endonuclease family protein [Atopococcus tabaci]
MSFFYKLVKRNVEEEFSEKDYTNKTVQNLIRNYNYLNNLLDNFIEERQINSDELLRLIKVILRNTSLITIKTATDELAMAMFETLNNTGKKLENFYVLKNDLVITLSEPAVKEKWAKVDSNLENYDPSQFLVSFATLFAGKSTKNNSLSKIYDYFDKNSKTDMRKLLDKLVIASENYLQIRNPSQLKEHGNLTEIKKYRKLTTDINVFNVKQHHSLLLAMFMKEKSIAEINAVLGLILNLSIRNFYFKEKRANTIEKPIADLAKDVYNADLSLEEITRRIGKMIIKDDELKTAIHGKSVTTQTDERRLKFILRETYNENDLKNELEIKQSLSDIHYEHILPQNPVKDSQWMKDFPNSEEREKYTRKLGNATLLLEKLNKNIGNKDFNEKRHKYAESAVPENKQLAAKSKWTKKDIDARTAALADKVINYLDTLSE